MSRFRKAMRRLSDRVHNRFDDTESRETLKRAFETIRSSGEAQNVKERVIEQAFEAAKQMKPAFDASKVQKKATSGFSDGSIAGTLACFAAYFVSSQFGIEDEKTKLLITTTIGSIASGLLVAAKRVYFNWQKHKFNSQ